MADFINVSTQQLTDTAEKIKTLNEKMDADLQNINQKMDSLQATWKSDAATDIRANMNALKPRFEEYKNVVESYRQFLLRTAQSYEQTEGTIQSNAAAFK